MRGAMDAGEYKHVALGLLFLRYVSAAFELKHAELAEVEHADPEDPEEYLRRIAPEARRQEASGQTSRKASNGPNPIPNQRISPFATALRTWEAILIIRSSETARPERVPYRTDVPSLMMVSKWTLSRSDSMLASG